MVWLYIISNWPSLNPFFCWLGFDSTFNSIPLGSKTEQTESLYFCLKSYFLQLSDLRVIILRQRKIIIMQRNFIRRKELFWCTLRKVHKYSILNVYFLVIVRQPIKLLHSKLKQIFLLQQHWLLMPSHRDSSAICKINELLLFSYKSDKIFSYL